MTDIGNSSNSVELATITTVVSSLERVVAEFYGPQCTQTLLTSQTGKAVVTSDGFSIVEALHAAHPITELVFKSLKRCHAVTLDGCKTFLIYLANFLVHLQEEISHGKFCHSGVNVATNKEALQRQGIICARNCLRQLKQDVLPKICQAIQLHSSALFCEMLQNIGRINVIKCLIRTTLMPHYNVKLCDHFTQILNSSLPQENEIKSSNEISSFLVDNFYDFNVKVADKPYGDSTNIEPFLLGRDFTLKHDNLFLSSQPSVLIFKGDIDGRQTEDDPHETVLVRESGQIVKLIQERRKTAEDFAYRCSCQKIDLLLCTQGVAGYLLDIFRRRNISVISNVSERDVDMLEELSGKLSITNCYDEIEERSIIYLDRICELYIGGRKYVQLKLRDIIYPIKHMIICAPTIGLCDQLAINLQKSLNAVKLCLSSRELGNTKSFCRKLADNEIEEGKLIEGASTEKIGGKDLISSLEKVERPVLLNNKRSATAGFCEMLANLQSKEFNSDLGSPTGELNIIEGGGAFEILIHKLLQDFIDSCTDPNLSVACEILQRTAISLVKKLYHNTSIQSESSKGFLKVRTVLEEQIQGGQLWGLNRRGIPCCMKEKGVIEPLICKIHILYCVLNLVDQLLGIDKIVSVKKLESEMDDANY